MAKKVILIVFAVFALGAVTQNKCEIVAHRGASFDAPENTIASAKLAWKMGS